MSRREQYLHRTYSRMSGRGRALMLRVRPTGWLALVMALGLVMIGVDLNRSVAYQLFALLSSCLLAAVIMSRRVRTLGTAVRQAPGTCVPGVPITVEIEIMNTGKRPWRRVQLLEIPPPPVPALEEFLSTSEPGEQRRNIFDRYFIFYRFAWLGERRQTFKISHSEIFDLAPGATVRLPILVLPLRRGIMELRDLRLAREDVFGFFRSLRKIEARGARLAVMPRPASVTEFTPSGSAARAHPGGEAQCHRSGQSDEFLTLREYRPGDPLQHIHWAAFARADHPIVREFEDVQRPRTALIVDTLLPLDGRAFELTRAFEAAVEAAASLAGLLQRGDTLLELLLVQERAYAFTTGPGHLQLRRLLEVLASIQPSTVGNLEKLERLAIAHASQCGNALFLGVQWDESRLKFLTRLRARGVGVRAIIVRPPRAEPVEAPHWVKVCDSTRIVKPRKSPWQGAGKPPEPDEFREMEEDAI